MKRILLAVITITMMMKTYAQQTEGMKLNLTAGINSSGITGRDADSLSPSGKPAMKPGFSVGLILNNTMGKHFSLRHELLYTFNTAQLKMEDGFNSRFNTQYIELFPATPAWNIGQLQVYAGAYIGLLLSASIQQKDEDGEVFTNHRFFGSQSTEGGTMQKWEAGFTGGAEYHLPKGFALGLCYTRSVTPMMENAARKDQWKIYRQSFRVSLAYNLNKK